MSQTSTCVGTDKHKGCGKEKRILCRGLCSNCYKKHKNEGFQEPAPLRPRKKPHTMHSHRVPCLACKEMKPHYGRGLCLSCYKRGWVGPVKTCADCGEDKPHFALGMCRLCYMRSKATSYNAKARDVRAALAPERRAELAAHHRTYRKLRIYGLSAERQEEMEAEQGRKCAICRSDFGTGVHYCHVDHCHVTGRCAGCCARSATGGWGTSKTTSRSEA